MSGGRARSGCRGRVGVARVALPSRPRTGPDCVGPPRPSQNRCAGASPAATGSTASARAAAASPPRRMPVGRALRRSGRGQGRPGLSQPRGTWLSGRRTVAHVSPITRAGVAGPSVAGPGLCRGSAAFSSHCLAGAGRDRDNQDQRDPGWGEPASQATDVRPGQAGPHAVGPWFLRRPAGDGPRSCR